MSSFVNREICKDHNHVEIYSLCLPFWEIGVSDLRGCGYHVASFLGLLPAQVINVYLGSTLRSMRDVLQESHLTGYIVFAFQADRVGTLSLGKRSCFSGVSTIYFELGSLCRIKVLLSFESCGERAILMPCRNAERSTGRSLDLCTVQGTKLPL
ncbi:Protein maelstrom [Eumeta japonica]|uniref:Protein maelstrom n=1 Tax=Eumeta variegata TaxID=151549 RepID=A0A4C1T5P0_EUMVA|nr:Protein maelstrom [Eumeta japonica]